MRYVCPKDVKKMLLKQARSTYWMKWAAKHEHVKIITEGLGARKLGEAADNGATALKLCCFFGKSKFAAALWRPIF